MNQVLALEKPITAVSLGSLLQTARLQRRLSLEEIAQRTFIKLHYLQALEEGLFDRLPAPVYTSGYIRQVARLLGLDDAPLIAQYQQNRQQQLAESPAGDSPAPAFMPVLSQRQGRSRVDTIRLMSEPPITGEANQAMEPMTIPQQQAGQKQVIETIEGARKEALAMRHQTEQFADQVLLHLEQEIQKTLGIVRNGRSYLQKRLNSYQF